MALASAADNAPQHITSISNASGSTRAIAFARSLTSCEGASAEHREGPLQRGTRVGGLPVVMLSASIRESIVSVVKPEPLPDLHTRGKRAQMNRVATAGQFREQRTDR